MRGGSTFFSCRETTFLEKIFIIEFLWKAIGVILVHLEEFFFI
jgi:hypothetical protein